MYQIPVEKCTTNCLLKPVHLCHNKWAQNAAIGDKSPDLLLHYREGLSIRKIASQLNIHRKTVKARLDQHERYKSASVAEKEDPSTAIGQYLLKGSSYDVSGRGKRKMNPDVIAIIEECLQETETKKLDGRQKQQLRRIDIHERILAAGHSISYSVICDYIQKILCVRKEAFIRQAYAPGDVCEFDWGEVESFPQLITLETRSSQDLRSSQLPKHP